MSNVKRVSLANSAASAALIAAMSEVSLANSAASAALIAAMSEVARVNSIPAYPQLRENQPKVSRKERRQMERSAAKQAKRSTK